MVVVVVALSLSLSLKKKKEQKDYINRHANLKQPDDSHRDPKIIIIIIIISIKQLLEKQIQRSPTFSSSLIVRAAKVIGSDNLGS